MINYLFRVIKALLFSAFNTKNKQFSVLNWIAVRNICLTPLQLHNIVQLYNIVFIINTRHSYLPLIIITRYLIEREKGLISSINTRVWTTYNR